VRLFVVGFCVLALVVFMATGCALFNDTARSESKDGRPARVAIEPQGGFLETECTGYRGDGRSVFYNEYVYTSSIVARSQLCPISNDSSGSWRVSEDISIDADVDTLRLIADLEAARYNISRSWPVPPTLSVFCWDRTDNVPGSLNVGLYHYGQPHNFAGTVASMYMFNDGQWHSVEMAASALEAEAVSFSPESSTRQFLREMMKTNEETGFGLAFEIEDGSIQFDVSGWEKAVKPLLEECGHTF